MNKFKIGDEVFHRSRRDISMIIEAIDGEEIHCSWLEGKPTVKMEEKFSAVSLAHVYKGSPVSWQIESKNRY